MKEPSDKTKLRTMRLERDRARSEWTELKRSHDAYRARATKAEQEAAEWKARFDRLLERLEVKAIEVAG